MWVSFEMAAVSNWRLSVAWNSRGEAKDTQKITAWARRDGRSEESDVSISTRSSCCVRERVALATIERAVCCY